MEVYYSEGLKGWSLDALLTSATHISWKYINDHGSILLRGWRGPKLRCSLQFFFNISLGDKRYHGSILLRGWKGCSLQQSHSDPSGGVNFFLDHGSITIIMEVYYWGIQEWVLRCVAQSKRRTVTLAEVWMPVWGKRGLPFSRWEA